MVDALVPPAEATEGDAPPLALVVPHAGYEYSGPVAGTAYARLRPFSAGVRRVVLLGPAHFVALEGLAASSAAGFATPLGTVEVDDEWREAVLAFPQVHLDDAPDRREHSLEVQLPFLQRVLGDFGLLPLLAGRASAGDVATVLQAVWGGPETVVVVSTDLSHYLSRSEAVAKDRATAAAIEALDVEAIRPEDACGAVAVRGALGGGPEAGRDRPPPRPPQLGRHRRDPGPGGRLRRLRRRLKQRRSR